MSMRPSHLVFLLLVALSLAPSFSMHAFLPALPVVQSHFGVGTGVVQLALSLAMVSIASMTLVYGPLSDRYGRRPTIILGMVLFLTGTVVCLVADDIWVLILGRVLQTGGASAGMVLGRTIARDIYGASETARILSYLIMATVVGSTLAPAVGGLLTDQFGWRSVFVFITAYGCLLSVAVVLFLGETNPRAGNAAAAGRMLDGFRRLVRVPAFWGYALISALSMAVFFAFLAAAPYLMADVLNQPARAYGFWFAGVSLTFVAGNFLSTRMMRRRHIIHIMSWGVLLCLATLIADAALLASFPLTPALLFLPACVVAFLQGLVISNGMAGAMNVDATAAGAAAGLTSFLQMSISAAVAQIVGMLENGTIWPMIGAMLIVSALSTVTLRLLRSPAALEAGAAG